VTAGQAAILTEHGSAPAVGERDHPAAGPGQVLIDVVAAPITPLDLLCASGTSYFGKPALPYVPGVQGVGVVAEPGGPYATGTPVWFATSAGMRPGDGSMASRAAVPTSDVVEIPAGVDPVLAAALGLSAIAAWMALTFRGELRPGETVLVLGAGGVVGQVGVQAARLLGADRVVAAARSTAARDRATALGADAAVPLDGIAGAGPVDLVLDPLFGAPAEAAVRALAPHGRLVNLGSSSGPTATVDSATVRGRSLRILGYTNNELTADQRAGALTAVLAHAAAGRLTTACERVPFADAAAAWARQAAGQADGRIVLDLARHAMTLPPPATLRPGSSPHLGGTP
jgi:NADPH:quinone reductase